jgi:hypothetical protein
MGIGRRLTPSYAHLPYGIWICADGREVLFNRAYTPIWQRRPGQTAEPADPSERVPDSRVQMLAAADKLFSSIGGDGHGGTGNTTTLTRKNQRKTGRRNLLRLLSPCGGWT